MRGGVSPGAARGVVDPVILVDASDPPSPAAIVVESREKLALAMTGAVGLDGANVLLTTPAARLAVLVLFGDEVHGYLMARPPG